MIELAEIGSFQVGGRALEVRDKPKSRVSYSAGFVDVEHDPNGHFWIEQAYVQFFIPARLRFATPLLLVHGGGLTGAAWENKPDGGRGWLSRFLEAGIATYVVDSPERGRAGFCAHEDVWTGSPIVRSMEESWTLYRIGAPSDFAARKPFPGQQFPVAAMDGLAKLTVPRWPANGPVLLAGLQSVVERIGRCVLLGHSQGGGLALSTALNLPGLVQACILLEPHGIPAAAEPGAVKRRSCLLVMGDFIELSDEWQDLSRKAHRGLRAWADAGGKSDPLILPDHGLKGNSHMLMMDRNSNDVADMIIEWLDKEHLGGRLD